jgi:hypothetical protein
MRPSIIRKKIGDEKMAKFLVSRTSNPQKGITDYCHAVSTGGLRKGDQQGRVCGLWRLQPVLSVRKK